jgi:hypothetical protein
VGGASPCYSTIRPVCLRVNLRPSRLRASTKGPLTRAIMECGHDAPAPQTNNNMLARCEETAGSSTAKEDLWEDNPDDLQGESDDEFARNQMEWRRDDAAKVDPNYDWEASVKVDRGEGDRWNVWCHDGDGRWAHSVALRVSSGVGLGLHQLTFAEYDARILANTMSEESQTAASPPVCLRATDDPVLPSVRHCERTNGHCPSILGWNRLDKNVVVRILCCLGADDLWNCGKVCRSWTPLALSSFREQLGPTKCVAEPTREGGLSQFQKEVATQRSFEEHNANFAGGGAVECMAHRQAVVQGMQAGVLGTSLASAVPCASHARGALSSSCPVARTLPVSTASSSSSSSLHGFPRRNVGQVGTGA